MNSASNMSTNFFAGHFNVEFLFSLFLFIKLPWLLSSFYFNDVIFRFPFLISVICIRSKYWIRESFLIQTQNDKSNSTSVNFSSFTLVKCAFSSSVIFNLWILSTYVRNIGYSMDTRLKKVMQSHELLNKWIDCSIVDNLIYELITITITPRS